MSLTIDELVERSGDLKQELLDYAHQGRLGRELASAMVERFGDPIATDEHGMIRFLDDWVLRHRLGDGRTVVERFVRARGDLPRAERDMMRGWRDPLEGFFEVEGFEGESLLASNVIDELPYRIRSNLGVEFLKERTSPGSFLIAQVVPVLDEWLISGSMAVLEAERSEEVLETAVSVVMEFPKMLFRNPERLRLGWQMQAEDRARFIEYFGADLVVVPRADWGTRWAQYWRFRYGNDAPAVGDLGEVGDSETVGLIYDEREGLGFFADFGALQEVFQRPDLARQPRYAQLVQQYLRDDSVSPVALRRCAELYPDGVDAVLSQVLRQKRFTWRRNGEDLMRRYKSEHLSREPLPLFLPFGPRLVESAKRKPPGRRGKKALHGAAG
jgi:hypothetical protein